MAVTIELPHEIEQTLRRELDNLEQVVKEAAMVGLYRQEKLTHFELADALGLSHVETEALLKKYHVTGNSPNAGERRPEVDDIGRLVQPL